MRTRSSLVRADGSKRLDDIAALARYNLDLQVKCRCGHTAVLNSDKVLKDCLGSMRDCSAVSQKMPFVSSSFSVVAHRPSLSHRAR
jgi:hypothetical protein